MAKRKKLFITVLADDPELSGFIGQTAMKYGIDPIGGVWREEPGKPVWGDAADLIVKNAADGWLLAGRGAEWSADSKRRGHVALAALRAANRLGGGLTLFSLLEPAGGELPTPLAGAIAVDRAKLGARLAAKLGVLAAKAAAEYFFDVHPLPAGDGFVAEIGPAGGGEWRGALFAVSGGGEITHHSFGPRGSVPERGVVEYPLKGVKLEAEGREFVGWGVANRLGGGDSYFLRVMGEPGRVLFGALPEGGAAELFTVSLE